MPESENTETPPVEIPEIAKTPDKAPEISAPDPATYKKKLDQLYWLRIIFAAASGIIATFAFDSIDGEERRWASIIFMIAVYLKVGKKKPGYIRNCKKHEDAFQLRIRKLSV